jgi:hypothetical protein
MEAAIQKILSQNIDIDPSGRYLLVEFAHCTQSIPVTDRVEVFCCTLQMHLMISWRPTVTARRDKVIQTQKIIKMRPLAGRTEKQRLRMKVTLLRWMRRQISLTRISNVKLAPPKMKTKH